MKYVDLARAALPLMAAFVSHTAFAQFTVISQAGRLEARPGFVVDLPAGQLDPVRPWLFNQNSWDPACTPPRCSQDFYHEVSGFSYFESNSLTVGTSLYASGNPVDLVNKGELSITFDVSQNTDVLLTLNHTVSLDGTGLGPVPTSYAFGRILNDGSLESVALPTITNGSKNTEKQLNLSLQAGRYVVTSRIEFNSAQYFPTGLPSGGALGDGGFIQITQVPEPATLTLAFAGLVVGLMGTAGRGSRMTDRLGQAI